MTEELINKIKEAGLIISLVTIGGVGGYFVADQTVTEPEPIVIEKPVFNWWGDEGKVVMDVYNAMLEEKKANCGTESDCTLDNGTPKITFEGISQDEIPAKLNEKLQEYNITVKRK